MKRPTAAVLALSACCSLAAQSRAQTVEFRFVERTGQSFIGIGGDNVLSFTVQGRIVGGTPDTCIGGFSFDIVLPGEPDTYGTLQRERISNADRTIYTGAPAVNNSIGVGGVAFQFSYLAGIGPNFNGVINTSSGTFTNSPGNQEIGNIAAACTGIALLETPGIDLSNGDVLGGPPDSNPDTWNALHPWNSALTGPPAPANNDIATINPASGATYLGVGGGWIDLYRFRYTATNLTPRAITVAFVNSPARLWAARADHLLFNNSTWATSNITTPVTFTPLIIPLGNPGACCDSLGACTAMVDTGCTGTFIPNAACASAPCPGACCTGSVCTLVPASSCSGEFHPGSVCTDGPGNPTTCCDANFDGQGGLQINDIFAWINAWFAGDIRTDSNHSGSLELFDIFTFLNNWFAGCS